MGKFFKKIYKTYTEKNKILLKFSKEDIQMRREPLFINKIIAAEINSSSAWNAIDLVAL